MNAQPAEGAWAGGLVLKPITGTHPTLELHICERRLVGVGPLVVPRLGANVLGFSPIDEDSFHAPSGKGMVSSHYFCPCAKQQFRVPSLLGSSCQIGQGAG